MKTTTHTTTTNHSRLLEVKREMKARQPGFVRQDAHKHGCLDESWRRPKGLHNKMRENRKGHPASVSKGYRSPVVLRTSNKDGLFPCTISNLHDLEKVNPQTHYCIISASVGMKKRIPLMQAALSKGIHLHLTHAHDHLKVLEEKYAARKKEKETAKTTKTTSSQKTKEKEKEAEKAKVQSAVSEKEKQEHEKREKEKILTQRN